MPKKGLPSLDERVSGLENLKIKLLVLIGVLSVLLTAGGVALRWIYKSARTAEKMKDEVVVAVNEAKDILEKVKEFKIDSRFQELLAVENRYHAISDSLKDSKNNYIQISRELEKAKNQYRILQAQYQNLIEQLKKGVALKIHTTNKAGSRKFLTGEIITRELLKKGIVDGKDGSIQRFKLMFDDSTRSLIPISSETDIVKFNFKDNN